MSLDTEIDDSKTHYMVNRVLFEQHTRHFTPAKKVSVPLPEYKKKAYRWMITGLTLGLAYGGFAATQDYPSDDYLRFNIVATVTAFTPLFIGAYNLATGK